MNLGQGRGFKDAEGSGVEGEALELETATEDPVVCVVVCPVVWPVAEFVDWVLVWTTVLMAVALEAASGSS